MEKDNSMVEIWGDVIEIKYLLMSIIITALFTMGAYFLAPAGDRPKELFYGLLGSLIGFTISSIVIRPKRIITFEENKTDDKE